MKSVLLATLASAALIACSEAGTDMNTANSTAAPAANATETASPAPQGQPFTVTPIADFDAPWAMTFLPDGRMLVTEKDGRMLLVSADGQNKRTVSGIPAVDSAGQGALKDVVLHPQFAQNRMVYFSFSEAGPGGKGVALARGVMRDGDSPALENVEVIFRATPYVEGNGHYSGRIAFSPDGQHLFFANGERQKFDPAQDPKSTLGKMLRLTPDGQPAGDPGLRERGFHPAVWSYGHRNILGLAFDRAGNLWQQEMGPKGGDEVNIVLPGRNYGYPIVSDGDHYDNEPVADKNIPDHSTRPEFEAPKVSWNPAISPAGLMLYTGAMFPEWQGDLFLGGLSSQALIRVDVNGTGAAKGDQWPMNARIREVEQGPDGAIYLLEDGGRGSQGRLLRLSR
jgi:glucose/arabinose dehydrogenase